MEVQAVDGRLAERADTLRATIDATRLDVQTVRDSLEERTDALGQKIDSDVQSLEWRAASRLNAEVAGLATAQLMTDVSAATRLDTLRDTSAHQMGALQKETAAACAAAAAATEVSFVWRVSAATGRRGAALSDVVVSLC